MDAGTLLWIPYFLISVVFMNRYFGGALVRRITTHWDDAENFDFKPRVAVIIPLYNEGETIYRTIKNLLAQTYDPNLLEVIVVDDASKDDSFMWASKAANESNDRVRIIRNTHNIGKRQGINKAVRMTGAEIVISVDSDAIVDLDAVEKLISKFTRPEIAAVGGRVMVRNANENWLTKMQAIKYFFGYEYLKNIERSFDQVLCLSGCITAYRRDVLIELEPILDTRNLLGVPIKYGEDRFLTRQIVKAGYKTRLTLDASCYTDAPPTLAKLFSQQLRWRRSNFVDFVGGLSHIWQLNPLVSIHYYTLFALYLTYPVFLIASLIEGNFFNSTILHMCLLSCYGWIYYFKTRHLDPQFRVHPIHFLWMSVIMPVTYMLLSVLALFTLDSDSWETRGQVPAQAPQPAPAHTPIHAPAPSGIPAHAQDPVFVMQRESLGDGPSII